MTERDESRTSVAPRLCEAVQGVSAVRYDPARVSVTEHVAVEEPLEILLGGEAFAVTMRTPGQDRELAVGFLLSEGLIQRASDLASVGPCADRVGDTNVIDVVPAPGTVFALENRREAIRGTLTTSACGVCGRRSIDDLLRGLQPLSDETRFSRATVAALPERLGPLQEIFAATGGLHAAALARSDGTFLIIREDVGRHNAVDKVFGRLALDAAWPAAGCALVVSGRSSFEIVQKAAMARVPLVVSVSAPSSLAVSAAQHVGMTLVGFARKGTFNVYSNPERIVGE